jgi:hypothetical protein
MIWTNIWPKYSLNSDNSLRFRQAFPLRARRFGAPSGKEWQTWHNMPKISPIEDVFDLREINHGIVNQALDNAHRLHNYSFCLLIYQVSSVFIFWIRWACLELEAHGDSRSPIWEPNSGIRQISRETFTNEACWYHRTERHDPFERRINPLTYSIVNWSESAKSCSEWQVLSHFPFANRISKY